MVVGIWHFVPITMLLVRSQSSRVPHKPVEVGSPFRRGLEVLREEIVD